MDQILKTPRSEIFKELALKRKIKIFAQADSDFCSLHASLTQNFPDTEEIRRVREALYTAYSLYMDALEKNDFEPIYTPF